MYFVYILRCADDSLYTGITTDLKKRLRQHLGKISGGAKYTKSHPPIGIEAVWKAPDRQSASRLEYYLHHLTRGEKLLSMGKTVYLEKTDESFSPMENDNPDLNSARK